MPKFSTGVKAIDNLLDGGISLGSPALIFGIPNLGKGQRALKKFFSLIPWKGAKELERVKEISYLAGSLDAGGLIDLSRLKKPSGVIYYIPRIRWISKEKELLIQVKKILNLDNRISKTEYIGKNKIHSYYELSIAKREDVKRTLQLIKDDLIVKRKQAELLLQFIEHRERQKRNLEKLSKIPPLKRKGQTTYSEIDERLYYSIKELNLKNGSLTARHGLHSK